MPIEQIVVGPTWAEPPPGDLAATHGEIAALAAPQGAVKLRSKNREYNRRTVLVRPL